VLAESTVELVRNGLHFSLLSPYLHCRIMQVKLKLSLQLNQVKGLVQHAILLFNVDCSYWLSFEVPSAALVTRFRLAGSDKISKSLILSCGIV
jgi:hypothetical protein